MARRISGKATALAQGEYAGGGAWPQPQAITAVGGEVRVNTATAFNQISGKGVALAGGGFVVVWDDSSNTGGAPGDTDGSVRLQLFDANGARVGTEILANSATVGSQGRAAVTALANGGFVVTWEDYSHGVGGATGDGDQAAVKAQIFTATGAKVGLEILVNSDPAGDQVAGPPVALSGGGFVVSWTTFDGAQGQSVNLRAEVFAANGTRVATGLVVDDGANGNATIIALDGNRFAVLWTEIGVTTPTVIGDHDVRMRIYEGNGVPADSVVINGPDSDWQSFESVAKVAGGGFVVTWGEQDPGGSVFSEIMAQRFDAAGAKIGTEFLVNTVTASYQTGSRVSGLAGGGFVITWTSQDAALGNEVRAQVYNAAGVAIGTELNVNTATASSQQSARIVALASGGFVVVWDDSSQGVGGATGDNNGRAIKGQEYDSTGMTVGAEFLVNTAIRERQQITDVIVLPDGRFAVIWDDASQGLGGATGDTSGLQVKLQVFQGATGSPGGGAIVGTPGNDDLNGTSGADVFQGLAGNDSYHVDNAGDRIVELANEGRDVVYAGVSWSLNAGAHVEVISAANQGGTAALVLAGNEFDQDIYGNAGNNLLQGGGGSDYLVGLAGDDSYIVVGSNDRIVELAGQGRDVVYARGNYTLAAGASIEVLSTGNQAATTTIELVGNELNQDIYGNAGSNLLQGGGGNDYLVGLEGDDNYIVLGNNDRVVEIAGQGRDVVYTRGDYTLDPSVSVEILSAADQSATTAMRLTGSSQDQEIYGNAGANVLDGGGGTDYMGGLGGNDTYFVSGAGDHIIEAAGQGSRDVVYARASYTLEANQDVEVLASTQQTATTAMTLTGNNLVNEVYGNNGANTLNGGGGSDYLMGFGGADTFAFTTALGASNVDQILDFSVADDTIALDDAAFTGLATGALAAGAFVNGSAAGDADDRILYNSATGQILFDADGNGAGAAVLFATVSAGTVLTASDFTVI